MIIVILLAILCLFLLIQLTYLRLTNLDKNKQIELICEELQKYEIQIVNFTAIENNNHNLMEFYYALGHSVAALHIQLQAAQKLWKMNPSQAHHSIVQAYDLSGNMMQDIRQIFQTIDDNNS